MKELTGYNDYGIISNCTNNSTISTNQYAGGITGYNDYGIISNCTNNSTISATEYAGEIAWYNVSGTINGCTNSGKISASSSGDCGGIIGINGGSGIIKNCTNSGIINYGRYTGGIAGYSQCKISNCMNTGEIKSTSNYLYDSRGIYGEAYGEIYNCISNCLIKGEETHYISNDRITLSPCTVQRGESVGNADQVI